MSKLSIVRRDQNGAPLVGLQGSLQGPRIRRGTETAPEGPPVTHRLAELFG